MRKHLKDEKRIIKLMYIKGLFKAFNISLKHIGWEYLSEGKRKRKRKGRNKWGYKEYKPELFLYTVDYWGEGDETSIVDILQQDLYWVSGHFDEETSQFVAGDKKYYERSQLIAYLKTLPTVKKNSKINGYLKRTDE